MSPRTPSDTLSPGLTSHRITRQSQVIWSGAHLNGDEGADGGTGRGRRCTVVGVVERRVNQSRNQKRAETKYFRSQLAPAEVVAALEQLVADRERAVADRQQENAGKTKWRLLMDGTGGTRVFHLAKKDAYCLIGFPGRPGGEHKKTDGQWELRVDSTPDPDGGTTVSMTLLNWIVDGNDGSMRNRLTYGEFVEDFTSRIGAPL